MDTLADRRKTVTFTVTIPDPRAVSVAGTLRALGRGVLRTGAVLVEWRRRARDRAFLAEMEPRMLRDIGVSEENRRQEAAKPFWRA